LSQALFGCGIHHLGKAAPSVHEGACGRHDPVVNVRRMDVEAARDIAFDLAQEAQELASAMTGIAAPDDFAGGRVESGEQAEGSVARIVMRVPPGSDFSRRRREPARGSKGCVRSSVRGGASSSKRATEALRSPAKRDLRGAVHAVPSLSPAV
jgi:hypothetical protein